MQLLAVKAYASLIGKSEKTVYKMIKNRTVEAMKKNGQYRIEVDKNLLKVIDRTQKALEEAKAVLKSIEAPVTAMPSETRKPAGKKTAAKKAETTPKAKTVKKPAKPKASDKSAKKTAGNKPPKKSGTKKR